ncbi:hypothetical protein ART_3382 [Arthrobacter sp. PAMC 25486]|uniref:hypothetical protein n=1 Tax=Arthrobacter sp. PAMC 25486 TaxID=1494608 RepID=UPI0005361632|nr:hypothetical protein [Arthrobacter sp. PAMC 25486]AIY02981.1 hypothetical protein ART_3382 [Arthrobacter sp. PAMC 25486]
MSGQHTDLKNYPELQQCLLDMKTDFWADPEVAVRSQSFIKTFHRYIAEELRSRLTAAASKKHGIKVVEEAKIFGSFKSKDVDVAVIHPTNGPLMLIGVRSQMSSVGKNVLTYYQDIVGECISLQERFPMTTMGYAYVHPLEVTPWLTKKNVWTKAETPNHARYARMYASIGERDDRLYKHLTGSYDQFAYSVVDFESDPIRLRDDRVKLAVPEMDLSIITFVDRMIDTFLRRNIWMSDIFVQPNLQVASLEADADDSELDSFLED